MFHLPLFALHHPKGADYHLLTVMDVEELPVGPDVFLWEEQLLP